MTRSPKVGVVVAAAVMVTSFSIGPATSAPATKDPVVGVNVVTRAPMTTAQRSTLTSYGPIGATMPEVNGLTMAAHRSDLSLIKALPFVAGAAEDTEVQFEPAPALTPSSNSVGDSLWNLDMVGVTTGPGPTRAVPQTGLGTYVAVIDTGLIKEWRSYLPADRVDVADARAFGGGGNAGTVVEVPGKWERDTTEGHGTEVASIVIGFQDAVGPLNSVAPDAMLIPVKVTKQSGERAWRSVLARGIEYVTSLKRGKLAGSPVVVNLSLASTSSDPLEQAVIEDAISAGVIVVAAAGNNGLDGLGFPAAYPGVISVGAVGWTGQFRAGATPAIIDWWYAEDVPDPTSADDVYVTTVSSRDAGGQDLDVLAPGDWIIGFTETNFFCCTSFAAPHVAGIAALMAEAQPGLTAAAAESALESSALPVSPGCRNVIDPDVSPEPTAICWTSAATGSGLALAAPAIAEAAGP